MRFASLWVATAIVLAACGGTTTTDLDSGSDAAKDSPTDVEVDAAACTPSGSCASPCPSGTVCLSISGPQPMDLGCAPIPQACNGVATCDCMKSCFCNTGIDKCVAQTNGGL